MSIVIPLRSQTVLALDLPHALDELEPEQRKVIEARWGLEGQEPLSDDEVAEKFNWDIEWVWDRYDKGMQMLGYLWLTETLMPQIVGEAA
jgi:DNA-directed RNA polymerase sigma subunit (sigma70/sigma32)